MTMIMTMIMTKSLGGIDKMPNHSVANPIVRKNIGREKFFVTPHLESEDMQNET